MQFDENKHPRNGDGKFTAGHGMKKAPEHENLPSANRLVENYEKRFGEVEDELDPGVLPKFEAKEELNQFLGEEFKDVKGKAAIDKIIQEKRGHVKGAFHREDIGYIDLVWGDDYAGLKHIIRQREKQGIDINDFLSDLTDTIENGDFIKKNDKGNYEFLYNGKMAIVAPEYHGNKLTFLLTAYKTRYKNKKAP